MKHDTHELIEARAAFDAALFKAIRDFSKAVGKGEPNDYYVASLLSAAREIADEVERDGEALSEV
jgi:hypothetical protein